MEVSQEVRLDQSNHSAVSSQQSAVSSQDSPYEYWSIAASLLPLNHVGDDLVIGKVGVAVEVNRLAEYGSNVLGITVSVAQN